MPTEKEIQEHLTEINLTVLNKERQKKLEWFREHHLDTCIIETQVHLLPKYIHQDELARKLNLVNERLYALQTELDWFKQMGLMLTLGQQQGCRRYTFLGERPHFDPEQRVHSHVEQQSTSENAS